MGSGVPSTPAPVHRARDRRPRTDERLAVRAQPAASRYWRAIHVNSSATRLRPKIYGLDAITYGRILTALPSQENIVTVIHV
jgi:hypothetical protein